MDSAQLLQALQYSFGKTQEQIKMAEQFLQEARTVSGFIPNLLVIACNKEVDILVRQAAIVNLYSVVKLLWTKNPENIPNDLTGDMQTLKDNILEAIIKCADASKIYKQMVEIIRHIAKFDFPNKWESLLVNIIEKIKSSNDFQEGYGSLLALSALFEKYKGVFKKPEKLEILIETTFGLLEGFAQKLLEDYGLQAAVAMNAILKIFSVATKIIMPRYFTNEKNVETWMTFFKLILDKGLDAELSSPTEDRKVIAQRENNVYWQNKEICARVMSGFLEKYRDVKNNREEHKAFSRVLMPNYAIPFLETFMQILYKKKESYVNVRVEFYALKYIEKSLKEASMTALLQQHLEFLLFDILIPAMCLTYQDNEDWTENPIEYIRNEEDLMERSNNLKIIASNILQKITLPSFSIERNKVGNVILMKFMEHAAHVLTTNTDPRTNQQADPRLKEAILHIIGVIYPNIVSNKKLKAQMQTMLEKFVIPEFKNEIGPVRSRACWLFGMYGTLKFQGTDIIEAATEGLYNCLLDQHIPVKVQAGLALERVLEQEQALAILKPGLNKIFSIYLELIEKTDNEHLVEALEGIIEKFGEDVAPFAVELITHFGTLFEKNASNNEEGGDNDQQEEDGEDEKELVASGCLSAISNILKCKVPSQAIIAAENVLIPLLNFTLTNDKAEDIEGGLKILSSMLYNLDTIPEKIWQFFLELNYMLSGKPESVVAANVTNLAEEEKILLQQKVEGWASVYISQIVPSLQNYIQKGRDIIFTAKDPYFNLTYIELLFKSIDKMYEISYAGNSDFEMAVASCLYVTIIENYPKEIDNLMPYFLDRVIEHLPKSRSEMMSKSLIQIVAVSLWYDCRLTLHYLEEKGATQLVFGKWMELFPTLKLDYECQGTMVGLASIFKANVSDIPQIVLTSLPGLIKELTSLTSTILQIRADADFEDEEDDEGDGDEESGRKGGKYGALSSEDAKLIAQFERREGKHHGEDDDDEEEDDNRIQNEKAYEWVNHKEEYDSPFDKDCEILYFKKSLEIMQQNQSGAYEQLIGCLSDDQKLTLQGNFEKAQAQHLAAVEQAKC